MLEEEVPKYVHQDRAEEAAKGISILHPATIIGTCFWIGKVPFASGTLGSIFGVFLIVVMAFLPRFGFFHEDLLIPFFAGVTIMTFLLGWWATKVYMDRTKIQDPSEIVIDEVVGIFLTVLIAGLVYWILYITDSGETYLNLLALSHIYLLTLFLLFRFFDIGKPHLVRKIDQNMKNALGVMLDDIVAAIYAAISFYVIFFILLFTDGFVLIYSYIFPSWVQSVPTL